MSSVGLDLFITSLREVGLLLPFIDARAYIGRTQTSSQSSEERLSPYFGGIRVVLPETAAFLFYSSFVLGHHDLRKLRLGDVVIDAGANVGGFTMLAGRKVQPTGFVAATEPHAAPVRMLGLSVPSNGLRDVGVTAGGLS
jgi:hypothetical protein